MQDLPGPLELMAAVAGFLRHDASPALAGHVPGSGTGQDGAGSSGGALAYQARVAANMLDIVRRQAALAPAADADERQRLQALVGRDGDLATLNQRLADAIAQGTLTLSTPGLADHLWRSTLDKLAVDQPAYETYRRFTPNAS
jgi:hypothetical protein